MHQILSGNYKFKATLGYLMSSKLSWVTVCDPVSKYKADENIRHRAI